MYYKFVPLAHPEMVMNWQRELCTRLKLKGRIIISRHGINGTLGGKLENLRTYKQEMNKSGTFRGIDYKWSDGNGKEFPRLRVKVRPELVAFGRPDEIKVNASGVIGGGKHLKPAALHALVKKHGNEVVFFDGRNMYEAAVGRFKNAVVPKTQTTRDFVRELESEKYNYIKEKPVVTYCTGGIRCEALTVLMKNRGFTDVYQADGGIVAYGNEYGDDGLWEGNLYIFDGRMNHKFSEKAKDIGTCSLCKNKTSNYENCANIACNKLVLMCEGCKQSEYCKLCKKTAQVTPQTT